MIANKISEKIDHNRRRFLGSAAMMVAAAQFGMFSPATAQSTKTKTKCARDQAENKYFVRITETN